mgnify:CR=1 FL=1
MKKIPLTKGKFALIDNGDFSNVSRFKWCWSHGYAKRRSKSGKPIYLHRFILKPKINQLVDHKNYNGLDNQRSNLRICSKAENTRNQRLSKRNKTGYKGVYFHKDRGCWSANIGMGGKHYAKYCRSKEIAAIEYNRMALRFFGEFAKLNPI